MNLEQIYRVLNTALPGLKLSYTEYKDQSSSYDYLFRDTSVFKNAFNIIDKFTPFLIDNYTRDVLKVIVKNTSSSDIVTTNKEQGKSIIYVANDLKEAIIRFTTYLEPIIKGEDKKNSLTVKFPQFNTLDELEKALGELRNALNVPVYELDGRIELGDIKPGSIIIDLLIQALESEKIVSMIGAIITSALSIKQLIIKNKKFEQEARRMELENDMLEIIVDKARKSYEDGKEKEAKEIISKYLPDKKDDPDTINNFKGSISLTRELLEKDVEFYPSISASDSVKNSFPDFNQKLLDEPQKELGKGNEPK